MHDSKITKSYIHFNKKSMILNLYIQENFFMATIKITYMIGLEINS